MIISWFLQTWSQNDAENDKFQKFPLRRFVFIVLWKTKQRRWNQMSSSENKGKKIKAIAPKMHCFAIFMIRARGTILKNYWKLRNRRNETLKNQFRAIVIFTLRFQISHNENLQRFYLSFDENHFVNFCWFNSNKKYKI